MKITFNTEFLKQLITGRATHGEVEVEIFTWYRVRYRVKFYFS